MLAIEGSALGILTSFVILIILGLILTGISKKLKISNILLLTIAGILLGQLTISKEILTISNDAVLTLSILTLVLVVFDGASRFKLKAVDSLSAPALELSTLFLFLNLIFITLITMLLFFEFTITNFFYSLVFSAIISGTDPASVFIMLKNRTNKVLEFLKIEGILNTPIIVLIPFIFLDILEHLTNQSVINFQTYFSAILTQILVGIGSGIIVGIIFFKAMKKFSEQTSALALICAALLSFILAENLNGNGVLAVAVLGFMFGAFYISKKESLQAFSGMLSNSLEILVFILLGFVIEINITMPFIIKSLIIFATLIITRFIAIKITLRKQKYTEKEIIYMTLNMPKGIAVAVLIFSLSFLNAPQINIINNLLIITIIYSIIISTIINKFSHKFINMQL